VQEALAGFNVTTLNTIVRNRTEYAKAARLGLTALETEPRGPAAQEINALVEEFTTLFGNTADLALEKAHAGR
jgi:cellulose biosynthesis protein BcsQ